MAYGDFKDLARTTASDKVLIAKPFNIAKNLKYDGYQRGLASMVYKFFDKTPLHLQINLLQVVVLNLWQINNLQMNFINQLLENLKEEESLLHVKTIFGVSI